MRFRMFVGLLVALLALVSLNVPVPAPESTAASVEPPGTLVAECDSGSVNFNGHFIGEEVTSTPKFRLVLDESTFTVNGIVVRRGVRATRPMSERRALYERLCKEGKRLDEIKLAIAEAIRREPGVDSVVVKGGGVTIYYHAHPSVPVHLTFPPIRPSAEPDQPLFQGTFDWVRTYLNGGGLVLLTDDGQYYVHRQFVPAARTIIEHWQNGQDVTDAVLVESSLTGLKAFAAVLRQPKPLPEVKD